MLRYDNAEDLNESIERLEDLLARLVPARRCRLAHEPANPSKVPFPAGELGCLLQVQGAAG